MSLVDSEPTLDCTLRLRDIKDGEDDLCMLGCLRGLSLEVVPLSVLLCTANRKR